MLRASTNRLWLGLHLYAGSIKPFLSKVFRNTEKKTFLTRSCFFGYGLPFFITVANVASTVGYLDTLNAAVTCDGGI